MKLAQLIWALKSDTNRVQRAYISIRRARSVPGFILH